MPLSSNTSALARRARRCAAEPSRASSIRSRRDSLSRKPGRIMNEAESPQRRLARGFSEFSQSRGIHLKNVPAVLERSVRASGFHFREVQRKPSWRIDLAAIRAAGKHHLDCLSANTRQQIRRSMRLYEKRGRLDIARARDVPEALSFLDGLTALHQSYWIGRGEPGGFSYPFFENFQRRLI